MRLSVLILLAAASVIPRLASAQTSPESVHEELPREAHAADRGPEQRDWAILPTLAVNPEVGYAGGFKLREYDLLDHAEAVDLEAFLGTEGVYFGELTFHVPGLRGLPIGVFARGSGRRDPAREFFGLGNNTAGPDPVSTHDWIHVVGTAGLELKVTDEVRLGASYSHVESDVDDPRGSGESTLRAFPDLAGVRGGRTNRVTFSAAYDGRDSFVRPTKGLYAEAIASISEPEIGSRYRFTRLAFDLSRVFDLWEGTHLLAVRARFEAVEGSTRRIPFYELAALGGGNTLRGFWPYRYLGKFALLANAEYRVRAAEFDFFTLWHVTIDAVAFFDAGRVFADDNELGSETFERYRFGYGGGVRIALGHSLLARIDVGVSDEYKGLVYLAFGHIF